MPTVNPSPIGVKLQVELAAGTPAVGYKLFTYVAGSVNTKTNTYTDSTGSVANANPIVLNSLGQPTTEIWIPAGVAVKHVLAPSTDTDPPTSPVWSVDNLRGINDTTITIDQWVSGPAPTYIGATQFSLAGDQTSVFHVGRRIKATVTAGTVYGRISVSAYAALTTITVVLDSGALDSGLSAVSYGLLSAVNPSSPVLDDATFLVSGSADRTKLARLEVDGLTTATTRVITVPDSNLTLIYSATAGAAMSAGVLTVPLRSYLAGLTLSTAGGSGTMSIAAGQATDSTNAAALVLAAFSKTTSAWALGTGNGGLDTGVIANTTWYAFYLIQRPDTGVVDVTFSTNGTTPTLPANYTLYRRIGWGLTNGSAQWVAFEQNGDDFTWIAPVNDVNATVTASANRTARTLTAAPSTTVNVDVYYRTSTTGVNEFCFLSSANMTDTAASATNYTLTVSADANVEYGSLNARYMLNSSRQMYDRGSAAGTMGYMTRGWTDTRGRDA